MRLSDFPRRVGPLSDDVRCLFQTISTDADVEWFEDHMEPACREALELARREADDPSWLDGFFQRAQGDCLIGWYARWHPESGLSIPTREQWDDFLEELKSKGVDY